MPAAPAVVNRNDSTADEVFAAACRKLAGRVPATLTRKAAAAVLRAAATDVRLLERDFLTTNPAEILKLLADAVEQHEHPHP